MRIFKQRTARGTDFERPAGMPDALHRLLVARGIGSVEQARAFLKPNASMLHPPALLTGIAQAAARLRQAVGAGERICIFGDYDVDGVSASAILSLALGEMGGEFEVYLPSRHEEGYGLNEPAVREIAARCALLVTVDCGITSAHLVSLAKDLGLDVIVTDHHRPDAILPDCIVVNPLVGDYPEPQLCGAGVAFKLAEELLGRDAAMAYIDLAALATVADIVPLTGENRAIVSLGLDAMNKHPRLGLSMLREVAALSEKPYTAGMLGFQIGPRLNASGRIGSAKRAFSLLTTNSPDEARALASELNEENTARKKLESEILEDALARLTDHDFVARRAIVLAGEDWNSGVIGLAASRLAERFYCPAILISLSGDTGVGSCRSIPGVDIHAALSAVQSHLVRFGGHKQAAGLTIARENIDAFQTALDQYLSETVAPEQYLPVTEYDMDARFDELDPVFLSLMESFAPTGMGNPAPILRTRAQVVDARRVGKDGAHLSLSLNDGTNRLRAIAFREGARASRLSGDVDVLHAPKINRFAGRTSVELEVRAIKPAGGAEYLAHAAPNDALFAAFLTEMLYNRTYSGKSGALISQDELCRMLADHPQGTLIIAADANCASEFSDLDAFLGEYPDDPRAFNAVCLMPAGEIPPNYRQVIYAGMPAPDGFRALDCPPAAWLSELPGIDELRRAYLAMKRLLSRPLVRHSLPTLAKSLTDECALGICCAIACTLALIDMELVVQTGDQRLALGKFRKVNPMDAPVFRAITALKTKGGMEESTDI
ncbi:MAG: single-stranded-DNA-specific exonuclease RecJ [Christensenellales bacterium]|jgi:single-stranded-DNA-specific exonuclease